LRERVKKIENTPRIQTAFSNCIIIGPDMYHDMVAKYGKDAAIDFLTKSALSGDSVGVIQKLYLDGINPDQYPIACRDLPAPSKYHFRYLNDNREVVDDQGGKSVQKIFTDRAHKAMILATNEIISKAMDGEEGAFCTLVPIQRKLASIDVLDIDRLANITNNPNHPFFLDDGETYSD